MARTPFFISRFERYEGITSEDAQRALLEIGRPAVDALTREVASGKVRWLAAKLLGEIGLPAPATIDVLRSHADELWCAMALGMLGDHDWLSSRDVEIASLGLTAPLKAIASGGVRRTLDYRPLEHWLDGAGPAALAAVEEELAPGTSYVEIEPSEVGEALRALSSAHAVVRWHAASLLGCQRLGSTASKSILPALAARLTDPHPLVRRLAVLSIAEWKSAAKPHRGALERLRDDPDEIVRQVVASALRAAR